MVQDSSTLSASKAHPKGRTWKKLLGTYNADKQEGYHRVERTYGSFARRFTLPSTVEMGNVTAQSRDGVLRIFLPKKAETKPRQIKVQTGSSLGGQGMGRTVPIA